MTTIITLIVLLIFAVLSWRNLRLGLTLLFGLLPSYLIRFSIGPIPTTLLECFVLVLAFIWLVKHHGWRMSLRSLGVLRVPLLLALAAACFSAALAPDVFSAMGILKAYYFEPVLVMLMLVSTLTRRRDWYRLFYALVVSGSVVAILGIAQFLTKLGIPSPWNIEGRVTSVFDFPNAVGLFLAPVLAGLIVWLVTQARHIRTDRTVYAGLASSIVIILAILLAKTEAALVAVPTALVVTLIISTASKKQKMVVLTAAVVMVATLTALFPSISEKLLLRDVSGQARISMWQETLELLADKPLIGAGLAGFPTAIAPYHDATYYEIFQYPHNIILNIWVELGIFGVIVSIIFALRIFQQTKIHRHDPVVLAVFAGLLTMTIHGLVDVPFFKNDLAMMTAGLLAALITLPSLKKT